MLDICEDICIGCDQHLLQIPFKKSSRKSYNENIHLLINLLMFINEFKDFLKSLVSISPNLTPR